jgi:hypothetical protein
MRATLDDFYPVVFVCLLFIIMCVAHCALSNVLLIKRVPDLSLYLNAKRLGRLCAGHNSDQSPFQCSTLCFSIEVEVHTSLIRGTPVRPSAQPALFLEEWSKYEPLGAAEPTCSGHLRPATPMTELCDPEVLFVFRSIRAEAVRLSFPGVHWLYS